MKIKCSTCGVFVFVVLVGGELLPTFCPKCDHVTSPHVPEEDYAARYGNTPLVSVSGFPDTTSSVAGIWDTNV